MSLSSFAAFSKDDSIRYNSSSGGLFSELANYIYSINGIVVGAAFDNDYKSVSHILTDNPDELSKLTTSKYLQSRFSVHKEIEEKLKSGKTVLCCGTPCQIVGLKSFLKIDYDNLYTVDFICHGTPLQKIWEKYANWQESNFGDKITDVNFRSKESGWSNFSLSILFASGKRYAKTSDKDPYMRMFLNNLSLSKGCFDCKFKCEKRQSDITLGDFWGIDEEIPEMNDNKGISAVHINTQKGRYLFDKIKDKLSACEIEESRINKHNPSALYSVPKPENYEKFMDDLDNMSFDKSASKYLPKISLKERLKKYRLIKKLIAVKHHFGI